MPESRMFTDAARERDVRPGPSMLSGRRSLSGAVMLRRRNAGRMGPGGGGANPVRINLSSPSLRQPPWQPCMIRVCTRQAVRPSIATRRVTQGVAGSGPPGSDDFGWAAQADASGYRG